MKNKKTQCKTKRIKKDGTVVIQNKVKYKTIDEAVYECIKQNLMSGKKEKVVHYKCSVCNFFHIGRNGELITDIYKNHLKKEKEILRKKLFDKNLENAKLKILGKIDLSKFSVKVKIRKNGTKKITYK